MATLGIIGAQASAHLQHPGQHQHHLTVDIYGDESYENRSRRGTM